MIRTTHVGSLPRPPDLIRTMFAKQEGVAIDPVALEARTRAAVAEVVAKQVEAGVDVVSDGEMGKPSYVTYITDRLDGFGGTSQPLTYADLVDFPALREKVFGDPGRSRRRTPACDAPIVVRDPDAARTDIEHLTAALPDGHAGFMNAASPGVIELYFRNDHYASREEYLYAIADAMRVEYEAIVGGRAAAADRLPGPRAWAATSSSPTRRLDEFRRQARAEHRGAQPRHGEHPAGADAHAHLLGQLRGPAPLRRAVRRHRRPRLLRPPEHDRDGGRQPAPRPRVAALRGRRRCPTARS